MAQDDRWTVKILSLPFFSDEFSLALLKTPLANLAFVHAIDVETSSDFVERIDEWAGDWGEEVARVLRSHPVSLEQFWRLACSAEKVFLQSTCFQLGFGLCEGARVEEEDCSVANRRRSATVAPLVKKVMQPLKKFKSEKEGENSSSTPLLDQENAVKAKWASRLEAIGKRAGQFAKLLTEHETSEELAPGEAAKLRKLVLSSGAPRTMTAHVRAVERYEHWAAFSDLEAFPLTVDKILKYALHLDSSLR